MADLGQMLHIIYSYMYITTFSSLKTVSKLVTACDWYIYNLTKHKINFHKNIKHFFSTSIRSLTVKQRISHHSPVKAVHHLQTSIGIIILGKLN